MIHLTVARLSELVDDPEPDWMLHYDWAFALMRELIAVADGEAPVFTVTLDGEDPQHAVLSYGGDAVNWLQENRTSDPQTSVLVRVLEEQEARNAR